MSQIDRGLDGRSTGEAGLALGTAGLLALSAYYLLTWLPHYLHWPYWADHDVLATVARNWSLGKMPYRDTSYNNFPGGLYLFLGLGSAFGWGRPATLFAADAALLLVLLALLLSWSRRCFGRTSPGAVGVLITVTEVLSLDYAHAAQRDWHAPALVVCGLLVLQGWPGRAGRLVCGLTWAAGFAVRPQAVLFLPAVWLAVWDSAAGGDWRSRRAASLEWGLASAVGLAAAFGPLVVCGVFDDFLRSLKLVSYGGRYNKVTPAGVVVAWCMRMNRVRWWAVAAGILALGWPFATGASRAARVWLVALAGATLYMPLSPAPHSYLEIPQEVVWGVAAAALVGLWLGVEGVPAAGRLVGVLLVLGLNPRMVKPEFSMPGPSLRSARAALAGRADTSRPPGYRHGSVDASAFYPWEDYLAMLDHLRRTTGPTTRVANALLAAPAVCSVLDRPSAFPAESVAWLRMVRPADEPRFAEALKGAADAVVVWVPGEVFSESHYRLGVLAETVRRHYRPEARFGTIEVWRRRPAT